MCSWEGALKDRALLPEGMEQVGWDGEQLLGTVPRWETPGPLLVAGQLCHKVG